MIGGISHQPAPGDVERETRGRADGKRTVPERPGSGGDNASKLDVGSGKPEADL
jgi:hypothetical protein